MLFEQKVGNLTFFEISSTICLLFSRNENVKVLVLNEIKKDCLTIYNLKVSRI